MEYLSKTINDVNTNNNSIQINERSRFTNYNNINSNKNNENNHELRGNRLFINNNSNNLISNYNNNNQFGNLFINSANENTYNNNYNNLDNISNIFSDNRRNERERGKERYVYISSVGKKYHGRPQCGKMKTSIKVILSKAEAMGLGPCLKCY